MKGIRMSKLKPITGLGWSGLYSDDTPGWCLSQFVDKYPQSLNKAQHEALGHHVEKREGWCASDMYRVRITIEPVKNKRGKYIVKRTTRKRAVR